MKPPKNATTPMEPSASSAVMTLNVSALMRFCWARSGCSLKMVHSWLSIALTIMLARFTAAWLLRTVLKFPR